MRVLHVVPTYLPAVRYGGPIFSVHGLCRALAEQGHEVHVFTTNVDGDGVSDVPTDVPVDLDGVQVTYFRARGVRRLYLSPSMGLALGSRMGGFDVAHLHSVFLWPTAAAAHAARRAGVPYALAPRGMLVDRFIRRRSRLLKLAWLRLIERSNLRHAHRLHVTSELELAEARRLDLPLPRPWVIANGVDLPPGPSDTEAADLPAPPYALFVGRINWVKGLDRVLRALSGTEIALVIAGPDEDGYRAQLEQLLASLAPQPRVVFLGPVDESRRWALLRSARFLVLASYGENFGNVVTEAMAVGCPAIVTPEVGAATILERSNAGVVTAAGQLAAGLERLWHDEAGRARMSEAGPRFVNAHLGWASIAAETTTMYQDMVDGKTTP